MRFIRNVLLLFILVVVLVVGYGYWSGNAWPWRRPSSSPTSDIEAAARRGSELTKEAAQKTGEALTKAEGVLVERALTAKIRSKMVLDDYVKARTIDVQTSGSVVTLTGVVESTAEKERAVRLAQETDGVERVIDSLEVRKR
jgi:hyperosmotically inducible periplasmic protein